MKDPHGLSPFIADVPDFPEPGILFRDLTPMLASAEAVRRAVTALAEWAAPRKPSAIVGIESRGFLFGMPLALELGIGLIPIRKPGKLPRGTLVEEYTLEYGSGRLEMHEDALKAGDRALILDDLLATGGTAAATAKLIRRAGAEPVGAAFVVELDALGGRKLLPDLDVESLIIY